MEEPPESTELTGLTVAEQEGTAYNERIKNYFLFANPEQT
jgi:hypothetical protein